MTKLNKNMLILDLNLLDLAGVLLISFASIAIQIFAQELPCPLCLLQRLGLLGIGFGYLLNVKYSFKPMHYAFSTILALITAIIATRQILLHIVPGSGAYGGTIFGLHLYTWLLIICLMFIIVNMITLMIPIGVHNYVAKSRQGVVLILANIVAILYIVALVINIVGVFLECGVHACPDNPTHYFL